MKHSVKHPTYVDGCYACRLSTVGVTGMVSLRQTRELGQTMREFTRENVEAFKKEKGYYPERVR